MDWNPAYSIPRGGGIVAPGKIGLGAATMLTAMAFPATGSPGSPPMPILEYIKHTWAALTRSNRDLARSAIDPKFHPLPNGRWPVFVPEHENLHVLQEDLRRAMKGDFDKIELRVLPQGALKVQDEGLLYLPWPYVVPGG